MASNHAEILQAQLRVQSKPLRRDESPLEVEIENRIKNLDMLVDKIHAARDQVPFSGKPGDLVHNLRVKIRASHDMVRVAKLLSEPARESMFRKVRDSLNDLEEAIASHLDVNMN